MSHCLACGEAVPDMPSTVPLKYCTQRCRNAVETAALAFLDAITAPVPDEPDTEGDTP